MFAHNLKWYLLLFHVQETMSCKNIIQKCNNVNFWGNPYILSKIIKVGRNIFPFSILSSLVYSRRGRRGRFAAITGRWRGIENTVARRWKTILRIPCRRSRSFGLILGQRARRSRFGLSRAFSAADIPWRSLNNTNARAIRAATAAASTPQRSWRGRDEKWLWMPTKSLKIVGLKGRTPWRRRWWLSVMKEVRVVSLLMECIQVPDTSGWSIIIYSWSVWFLKN